MCKTMRLLSDLVHQMIPAVQAKDALNAVAIGLIGVSVVMLATLVI
jgi:hypothetical protein